MNEDTSTANDGGDVNVTDDTSQADDVDTTAEETATDSSNGEETEQDVSDKTETLADGTKANKPVPYSRFKAKDTALAEAKARIEELESSAGATSEQETLTPEQESKLTPQQKAQYSVLKEQLKGLGFVTKDDYEAGLQQTKSDANLEREIDGLSREFDGKDGRPKFGRKKVLDFAYENGIANLRMAYKLLNESKLTDWSIKTASSKTKGIKSETSTGSGSTQSATSDDDLKQTIAKSGGANKQALGTYLKRRIRVATKRK